MLWNLVRLRIGLWRLDVYNYSLPLFFMWFPKLHRIRYVIIFSGDKSTTIDCKKRVCVMFGFVICHKLTQSNKILTDL
jgi:hypothetical protein